MVGRRKVAGATGVLFALVTLLNTACTDPRARPAPPQMLLQFAPSLVVKSPGRIQGSLYAYDPQGIDRMFVSVRSSDSTLKGDSTLFPSAPFEVTRSLNWTVPGGLPIGTRIRVSARVTDFVGFAAADSAFFTVQDTVQTSR